MLYTRHALIAEVENFQCLIRSVNSQKSPVVVTSRLKKVLGLGSLEDILQDYTVNGGHVRHNCIFLNKSGIVTNIQLEGQFCGVCVNR